MNDWQELIKKDLTPFSDPGTIIRYAETGRWFTANWTSRRVSYNASFTSIELGDVIASFENREMPYRAFLAHPAMSDMLGLAGMILQTQASPFFVGTTARRQQSDEGEHLALSLLDEVVQPGSADATEVVFITGDAGAGKTEVLRKLVHQQAERYMHGETDFLYLYVNAQGRALARLDEALATEIQDLRATNLTYHAVPALTRNGALVPLIDGFDELLGVLGYEDSFSSLRRFLEELEGKGCLIASARSTYYQQEFLSRSARSSIGGQRVRVEQIEMLPWSDDQFGEYLDLRYAYEVLPQVTVEEYRLGMTEAFSSGENKELKTKPFFVAKASDLVLDGRELMTSNLVNQLVDGYIAREHSEKLLDRNGVPLLTTEQIKRFVQMVSEEMWISETRSLDSETIRILAELAFPIDVLRGESSAIIKERSPSMAFFSPASGRERVEFEHQLFFSYFLGNTISAAFNEGSNALFSVLTRSVLPEHAASFAAGQIWENVSQLRPIASLCGHISVHNSSRSTQIRENAGSLVAACMRAAEAEGRLTKETGVDYRRLTFAGESFKGINIVGASFRDVEFRRSDLSSVIFTDCVAAGVSLYEVTVDPENTRLEISGLDPINEVFGIRVRRSGHIEQVFRSEAIIEILCNCGLKYDQKAAPAAVQEKVLDLLEKTLRRFERSSLFWPSDAENKQLVTSEDWPNLEKLLMDSNIVTREENIPHKGAPRHALKRNLLPYQIMRGQHDDGGSKDNVARFWAALRQKWPSKSPETVAGRG